MLNTFPDLLFLGFFAPTLLRVAAACVFAYTTYYHSTHISEIAHANFPVVGAQKWMPYFAIAAELAIALCLLLGYYTQVAAIFGALAALKYAFWAGKYPSYFVLSRSSGFLLLAICLSLLVSGAGHWAFDVYL